MNLRKNILTSSVGVLIVGLAPATWAGPVGYAPAARTLAGTFPLVENYELEVICPDLNKSGKDALAATGVTANLVTAVTSCPPGVSSATALGYVGLNKSSLTFHAEGEAQTVTVSINFQPGAVAGDYMYSIQAGGPSGIGWGTSEATLTVSVSEPVSVDLSPPTVQIDSPVDGSIYVFSLGGTQVPVEISANDPESPVTAVSAAVDETAFVLTTNGLNTANVTASGYPSVGSIGTFAITAQAESAGGIGCATPVTFTVRYDLTWRPPLSLSKTAQGGSEMPIKFAVKDCVGNFVHDESVVVEVSENGQSVFIALFGDNAQSVRIDEGDPADPTDGHYIANFKTARGGHTYVVTVYFAGTEEGVLMNAIPQGLRQFITR
ncbi:MAG TPA: hypothetical protein VGA56_01045 [Opitutaceae bacterium]